jgi:hypothetical protein
MSIKNSSNNIGKSTRDLTACSAVPQPIASPGAPRYIHNTITKNIGTAIVLFVKILINRGQRLVCTKRVFTNCCYCWNNILAAPGIRIFETWRQLIQWMVVAQGIAYLVLPATNVPLVGQNISKIGQLNNEMKKFSC